MNKLEVFTPQNKNMPNASWCVFNSTARDQRLAREAFYERYGKKLWYKVRQAYKDPGGPMYGSGIMAIFKHKPNEYTVFYVNFIAQRVDRRALAREAKEATGNV